MKNQHLWVPLNGTRTRVPGSPTLSKPKGGGGDARELTLSRELPLVCLHYLFPLTSAHSDPRYSYVLAHISSRLMALNPS